MTYRDDFSQTVKEVIEYGKAAQVEKITLTWQQFAGKDGPLNHALTVTYREPEVDYAAQITEQISASDTPFADMLERQQKEEK